MKNMFLLLVVVTVSLTGCKGVYSGDLATVTKQNEYFFPIGTTEASYRGTFSGSPYAENYGKFGHTEKEVKIVINELNVSEYDDLFSLSSLGEGNLYELRIEPEFDSDWDGRDSIGYFYVTADRIYRFFSSDYLIESYGIDGYIVCQVEGLEDPFLDSDEIGIHHWLEVDGDKRIFHFWVIGYIAVTYYETMIWEVDKGLVHFRSGFGAERDGMELNLID